jgi:CheY-like chemotaxis protein
MEPAAHLRHSLDGQTILLVEDNEDDVFMMQRAFRKASIPNQVLVVNDGEEALDYLEARGKYADRKTYPVPIVVFLDLNMPKKSGTEVLEYIRHSDRLRSLAVNILTASTRPADIDRTAALGVSAYFIKPSQIERFQELIRDWYSLNRFTAYSTSAG